MTRYKGHVSATRILSSPLPQSALTASPTICVLPWGKREGDWPFHHEGTLQVECFGDDEALADIQRRCRCTAGCGWRRADLRPDYSVQPTARQNAGWMMPPGANAEIGPSPVSACRPSLEKFVTSENFGDSYNLVTKETRQRYFGNQQPPSVHPARWPSRGRRVA